MGCVQKSDMGMTKKWGKSAKIWGNFKLQYLKAGINCFTWITIFYTFLCNTKLLVTK